MAPSVSGGLFGLDGHKLRGGTGGRFGSGAVLRVGVGALTLGGGVLYESADDPDFWAARSDAISSCIFLLA